MTQEESKDVNVGDKITAFGKLCRVDDIIVTGCEYHPYFKLTPVVKCTKAVTSKITNGFVCYSVCDIFKEKNDESASQ